MRNKLLLAATAATLPMTMSHAWAEESHNADKDKQTQSKMQENMLRMHEQMHKIMAAKTPQEREQLTKVHAKMMQEMQAMKSMNSDHEMMGNESQNSNTESGVQKETPSKMSGKIDSSIPVVPAGMMNGGGGGMQGGGAGGGGGAGAGGAPAGGGAGAPAGGTPPATGGALAGGGGGNGGAPAGGGGGAPAGGGGGCGGMNGGGMNGGGGGM